MPAPRRRPPGPAWRCWAWACCWRWRRRWASCRWRPMRRWRRCCAAAWCWCPRWCGCCCGCRARAPAPGGRGMRWRCWRCSARASSATAPARRWPARKWSFGSRWQSPSGDGHAAVVAAGACNAMGVPGRPKVARSRQRQGKLTALPGFAPASRQALPGCNPGGASKIRTHRWPDAIHLCANRTLLRPPQPTAASGAVRVRFAGCGRRQLLVQRGARDAQQPRRRQLVAPGALQRVMDATCLQLGHRLRQ